MSRNLGDRIRELREASDDYRSLRQFAEALNKSPSWVSKVERNLEVPGPGTLAIIAQLLDADADELFDLAKRLDPTIQQALEQRYAEVSGLLRTLKDLSPEHVAELERQARIMKQRD